MNALQSDKSGDRTLIDQLLEEQRALTAVARFSQRHENHELPRQAKYYRDLIPLSLPKKGQQYAFEVDLDKCSGCKACVTACHSLNGLDEGETWRSVGMLVSSVIGKVGKRESETWSDPASRSPSHFPTFSPDQYQQHVTTACHHCVDPACLNGCPVLAYEKDSVTGIVHHLDDQCIGCSYCVMKCPYEVPQYHKKKGIVRKCDMCSSRLLVNEAPACVQACPNEAIRITLVGKEQTASETTNTSQLVPGAPDSDYTIPTTRYRSAREFPSNTQPADFAQLKPAPSHPPLVFMLILTQLSVGMFCVGWLNCLFFPTVSNEFQKIFFSVALLFGFLGLGASVLHLGRPLQAWRAFLGWRTSWLSREIIFFGVFVYLAAWQTVSFWFPLSTSRNLLQAAGAITGLIAVFSSVMVYVDTRRACWNLRFSGGKFFGSTILLGLAASVALSLLLRSDATIFSVVSLILFSAAKLLWESKFLQTAGRARHSVRAAGGSIENGAHGVTRPTYAQENESTVWPLKQSALLQIGMLRRTTFARFICGALGGIILPVTFLFSAHWNPIVLSVVAIAGFALCLVGELLERYLFFTAVVAPKMPGGVSL